MNVGLTSVERFKKKKKDDVEVTKRVGEIGITMIMHPT